MRFACRFAPLVANFILVLLAACAPATSAALLTTQERSPIGTEASTLSLRTEQESQLTNGAAQISTPVFFQPTSANITRSSPGTPSASTPSPSPTPSLPPLPSATPCPSDLCTYSSQFFLARPIAPPGYDAVDVTYRFGSTLGGRRDPHHGVEFLNGFGTPVLAAADGVVVVAGDDRQPTSPHGTWPITFYGPYSYFYGNLVVVEHLAPEALMRDFPGVPQPIYSLYAHLSEISVEVGERVKTGQQIGKVGMTGVAEGSHLHFEVRLGENTYQSARNPELWLVPHIAENGEALGGIAARFIDSYGTNLEKFDIVLEHLPDGPDGPSDFEVTLLTYQEKALIGQPPWEESFAIGDIPAGWYRLTFPHFGLQERLVQVFPGQLTVVTFRVE